jgi:hypothetical protein
MMELQRRFHRLATRIAAAAIAAVFLSGCARDPANALVIATDWTTTETSAMPRQVAGRPIVWRRVARGDDPTRIVEAGLPVAVVLGGPWASFERLDAQGRWHAAADAAPPYGRWQIVPRARRPLDPVARVWSDPRRDPAARGEVRRELAGSAWPGAYAEALLGQGGQTTAEGSTRDDLDSAADSPLTALEFEPIAIVGGRADSATAEFLRALDARPIEAIHARAATLEPVLLELAGACFVDASAELHRAIEIEPRLSSRHRGFLLEPPPWPPASVTRLREQASSGSVEAGRWLETLAREIEPDDERRARVLESWESLPRAVDSELLDLLVSELSTASPNPRFRSWLRAEWTAWARQRFRRVVRLATDELEGSSP